MLDHWHQNGVDPQQPVAVCVAMCAAADLCVQAKYGAVPSVAYRIMLAAVSSGVQRPTAEAALAAAEWLVSEGSGTQGDTTTAVQKASSQTRAESSSSYLCVPPYKTVWWEQQQQSVMLKRELRLGGVVYGKGSEVTTGHTHLRTPDAAQHTCPDSSSDPLKCTPLTVALTRMAAGGFSQWDFQRQPGPDSAARIGAHTGAQGTEVCTDHDLCQTVY